MSPKPLESPFPQLGIVIGALMMSQVLFVAVAYLVEPEPAGDTKLLTQILSLVGIVPLFLSFGLRRIFLSTNGRQLKEANAETPRWVGAYTTTHILAAALAESTGLFGFTISFLSGDPSWVLGYCALGIVAIGLQFPTPDRYRKWRDTWRTSWH